MNHVEREPGEGLNNSDRNKSGGKQALRVGMGRKAQVQTFPSTLTWTTASFGHSADMSALEVSELSTHLTRCRASPEQLILHRAAQSLREFVAAHFVTTGVAIAALVVLFRFWW